MYRFGILLLVSLVTANDLAIGPKNVGKNIFNEIKEASPAIWRQVHNVTINATNDEIINSINILDLRPDKDGEANIVDGGVGHQNVTIELKSPAVFRGYTFQIQVCSVPVSEYKGFLPENKISTKTSTQHENSPSQKVPILITKDSEDSTRLVRKSDDNKSTNTKTIKAVSTSTINPEQSTNDQTPKIQETSTEIIKSTDDLSTLPTTEATLGDDLSKSIPKFHTKDNPLPTNEIKTIEDLPTTEDDAQLIGINQQGTVGVRYPPITHEEQGTKDDSDIYTSQASAVTVANEPAGKDGSKDISQTIVSHINPTIPTAKAVLSKQDVTNMPEAKTNPGNEVYHQKGLHEKQNVGIPLPYINH